MLHLVWHNWVQRRSPQNNWPGLSAATSTSVMSIPNDTMTSCSPSLLSSSSRGTSLVWLVDLSGVSSFGWLVDPFSCYMSPWFLSIDFRSWRSSMHSVANNQSLTQPTHPVANNQSGVLPVHRCQCPGIDPFFFPCPPWQTAAHVIGGHGQFRRRTSLVDQLVLKEPLASARHEIVLRYHVTHYSWVNTNDIRLSYFPCMSSVQRHNLYPRSLTWFLRSLTQHNFCPN